MVELDWWGQMISYQLSVQYVRVPLGQFSASDHQVASPAMHPTLPNGDDTAQRAGDGTMDLLGRRCRYLNWQD